MRINDRNAAPCAAVVGAGLAGLSGAYRLQQAGWRVSVFESSEVPGGRVQTVSRDGYLIDTGASALADTYRAYLMLVNELGLGSEVAATAPAVAIYRDGRLHELRLDRLIRTGLRTRVLSWSAKLRLSRLAWDIAIARWRGQLDYADMSRAASLDTESAADYARRALGREVDDYLASPIVRTMLIADAHKVSKVELLSGVANIFSSRMLALRGGQARLPQLLAQRIPPRFGHTVQKVQEDDSGVNVQYRDSRGTQQRDRFDACLVACQLPEALQICIDHQVPLQRLCTGLRYTQCITVAVGLRRQPRSAAFLVHMPQCEDAEIALLFLEHNKVADRVPAGCGLISCHWETAAATEMMGRTDNEIVGRSLDTVLRVFPELRGNVAFGYVTRWRRALPLTAVGAYRLICSFNAAVNPRSRVQFAGDYMSAAGQNTAVELGSKAARRLTTIHGH